MIDAEGIRQLAAALGVAAMDAQMLGVGFIKMTHHSTGKISIDRLNPATVELRLKQEVEDGQDF